MITLKITYSKNTSSTAGFWWEDHPEWIIQTIHEYPGVVDIDIADLPITNDEFSCVRQVKFESITDCQNVINLAKAGELNNFAAINAYNIANNHTRLVEILDENDTVIETNPF